MPRLAAYTKEAIAALDAAKLNSKAVALDLLAIHEMENNQSLVGYNLLKAQAQELRNQAGLGSLIAAKDTSNTFAQTLHDDVKNALSTAFRDTKDPIAAFGNAVGNVLFTRVTSALADSLATSFLKSEMGVGLTSLFSFAGGGYTGDGARSGGVDGMGGFMAVMHPQETVIDHTRPSSNDSGSGQTIHVTQNFTVGDVASISMVRQAVAGSEKRIAAGIGRSMSYGGALS